MASEIPTGSSTPEEEDNNMAPRVFIGNQVEEIQEVDNVITIPEPITWRTEEENKLVRLIMGELGKLLESRDITDLEVLKGFSSWRPEDARNWEIRLRKVSTGGELVANICRTYELQSNVVEYSALHVTCRLPNGKVFKITDRLIPQLESEGSKLESVVTGTIRALSREHEQRLRAEKAKVKEEEQKLLLEGVRASFASLESPEESKAALKTLLLSIFSREALEIFIRFNRSGREVISELPGENASGREFVTAAVSVMLSKELIDDEFFNKLIRERPASSARINAVRSQFVQ